MSWLNRSYSREDVASLRELGISKENAKLALEVFGFTRLARPGAQMELRLTRGSVLAAFGRAERRSGSICTSFSKL